MSETRFPNGVVPPIISNRAPPSAEPNARLVSIPDNVREEVETRRSSLRIEGKIVRQNEDGSLRVRTPRGDIDVRVNASEREVQRAVKDGRAVEIEIAPTRNASRAPDTAVIREIQVKAPPPRSSSTPVDVEVQTESAAPLSVDQRHAAPSQSLQPAQPSQTLQSLPPYPPAGSVVHLTPVAARDLPPVPVPDILPHALRVIPAAITIPLETVVQNPLVASTLQSAPVLEVVSPNPVASNSISTSNPSLLLLDIAPANQPVILAPPSAPPSPNTPLTLSANLHTIPVSGADIFLTQSVAVNNPALSVLSAAAAPPAPPSTASISNLVVIKPQAFDGVVQTVQPADVVLTPLNTPVANAEHNLIPETAKLGQTPNVDNSKNIANILDNQKSGTVTGVVTNISHSNLPVISLFFPQSGLTQNFALQYPSDALALGTQIHITPQTILNNAGHLQGEIPAGTGVQVMSSGVPFGGMPLSAFLAPQPWPALDDVLQILARTAPQTAQGMANVTPSPNAPTQFGPALMFFVAAVRGGDLTQWLGDKASDLLKTHKSGQALNALLKDSANLSRIASEPMPQDWRVVNVPFYHDGDMQKIGLYYRHERNDSDESTPLKGTRFVFDLALEQMGSVQLDGLFRPASEAGKRLDLVVRTEDHFTQNTQAEMRRVYAKALRETGVTGELSFQNSPESWVRMDATADDGFGVNA